MIDLMKVCNRKLFTTRVCVILIAFLCIPTVLADTKEKHIEPNGFIWYEESKLIDYSNYRRGNYNWAYDMNGRDLFGRTYGVTFLCVDSNDEGQFSVKQYFGKGEYGEGLYTRDGKCILPPQSGPGHFKKRFGSGKEYYYIVYHWRNGMGVMNDKGSYMIPFKYQRIENTVYKGTRTLEDCVWVENDNEYGLVKLDGSFIVKPQNNVWITGCGPFIQVSNMNTKCVSLISYEGIVILNNARSIEDRPSKNLFKVIMADNHIGFIGYDGKWILSPELGYTYIDESSIGADKSYCKVGKNGMRGILDSTQKEILPCEFEDIEYIGGDFFKFKSGDFWGVINVNGKIIIPTSRGYSTIGKYSNIQKTFPFTKTGYKGECNHLGRQISLIKTENNNPKAVFTKINGNKSNSKTGKSNTQETVVSTPTKKSNNIPMVFHYTKSGRGQSLNTGEWTDGIDAEECNVEFFAKYIIVNGLVYELVKTKGPWKIYGGQSFGFGGHNDTMYYYVDDNKNMKQICEFSSPFGFDTFVYPMSRKGDPTPTDRKDSNTINKTRNGESSQTSSVKVKQSTCSYCNGAGVVEKNDNAPSTFGNRKPKQQCKECGKWYDPNLFIHYHQICRHCNGTGEF